MKNRSLLVFISVLFLSALTVMASSNKDDKRMHVSVRQITSGTRNHFFGYIGNALTIPWNADERYVVALETEFFERMPEKGESARIVLIDMKNNYKIIVLDSTLAWNLQQGTMFFWNPDNPGKQFFFNDLDTETGVVYTVLYDIKDRRRIREYRFGNQSIANGGVNPRGVYFAGINYGRLSFARKVISYAGAKDWTQGERTANPDDDGLFLINIATGAQKLLIDLKTLARFFNVENSETYPLNVHYVMWNRDGDRIFFLLRGTGKGFHPNIGCIIHADGSGLKQVPFTGHPEWAKGKNLAIPGKNGFDLYNVDQGKVVSTIGNNEVFRNTWEDNVLSPDASIYVGSHNPDDTTCVYTFLHLAGNTYMRSPPVRTQRRPKDNDCRIDPAPCWNRSSNAIIVPGIAENGTRQIFEIRISEKLK